MISVKWIKSLNKFFLAWDKFLPKFQLRQPGFTYNVCRPFTKHRERIQNFGETGKLKYIYKNELDKTYFFS